MSKKQLCILIIAHTAKFQPTIHSMYILDLVLQNFSQLSHQLYLPQSTQEEEIAEAYLNNVTTG